MTTDEEFDRTQIEAAVKENFFEGHVDFFGYHEAAKGFFFGGWISHPWPAGDQPQQVRAQLAERAISGGALTTYYHREDVESRGIGFVFFIACPADLRGDFVCLEIEFSRSSHKIYPTRAAPCLRDGDLVEWLQDILAGGEEQSHRRQMRALLFEKPAEIQLAPRMRSGFIDFYGYHGAAGGWLLCGWTTPGRHDGRHDGRQEGLQPQAVVMTFEGGHVSGDAVAASYPRSDLGDAATAGGATAGGGQEGVVFFVQGSGALLGALCSISFEEAGSLGEAGARSTLFLGTPIQRLREQDLNSRLRPILASAAAGGPRDIITALLGRQPYSGVDTLAALSDRVFLEIDEAIFCPPDGLLIIGWCLARPGVVRDIRLRCGQLATQVKLSECIRVDRPDVLASVGTEHGFDDARCGFIAFVPHAVVADGRCYIEIETTRREIGYRSVAKPRLEGMAAIRRLLECFELRFMDVPAGFDRVIGPAVELLNQARLRARPAVQLVQYGDAPVQPRFSVIVPLYGRIDFVEYQLGLFCQHAPSAGVEFIYVLDDPPKRREALLLFASIYERFRIPFRAVLLDRNVGFAPANNIGLGLATGEFVAFLNSDVFPGTLDWLERLAARLVADPGIGVIGPLLLFEDGSVQHQGMYFKALSEFGGWSFGQHFAKGLHYTGGPGLRRCISITGACMLMRRSLAVLTGGFDEGYVIGDFEDSDLCLKLHAKGLDSVVDPAVRLFHLERKSQESAARAWRMNLTLYNAWRHERRWARTLAKHPLSNEPLAQETAEQGA
jgi:O-antigen biosynthesis protein